MNLFSPQKIHDNPNPNATIGFLCWNPFHYYVYKNIYKHLPDAEFIIGDGRYLNKIVERKNIHQLIEFLNKKGVYWRFFDKDAHQDVRTSFMKKYRAVISVWHIRTLILEGLLDDSIIKIRVLYGNAKDLYNFGLWNSEFDLILTYGPYSQKFLEIYTNAKIVGNPKFDDWFNNTINQQTINEVTKQLDPTKKTILYLPTHDMQKGMSSLPELLNAGNNILKNYNFIIKLHYLTRLNEDELVNKLNARNIIIFDERHDILPLLEIADYVISDNSGAIFDALLAEKPVILFKTPEEIFKEKLFAGPLFITGMMTDAASLEQRIKQEREAIGPIINSIQELPEAISNIKTKTSFFKSNADTIRASVYKFNDGECGLRAAQEIKNAITSLSNGTFKRTFINRARNRENLIIRGELELRKKISIFAKIPWIIKNYFSNN